LRYFIRDCYGRDLACVLFGCAAWKVKARDRFIGFLNELAAMLRAAVVLKEYKAQLDAQTFSGLYQALQRKAAQLLDTPRREPTEEAVRKRLHKQRDHLFTFLDHDGVDATNNLAERQLRPAVIARKISCGDKTRNGATTWQILASLAATVPSAPPASSLNSLVLPPFKHAKHTPARSAWNVAIGGPVP
jgi:hypothetical protein